MRIGFVTSSALFFCLLLSVETLGQVYDGEMKVVGVNGASLLVPPECNTRRSSEFLFECSGPIQDGAAELSILLVTQLYPTFSSMTQRPGASKKDDRTMVLNGFVEQSREGMAGPGYRMDEFSEREVPRRTRPKSAEECRLVKKLETIEHDTGGFQIAKQELACVILVSDDEAFLAVAVYAVSFLPDAELLMPPDFEQNAERFFMSFSIQP